MTVSIKCPKCGGIFSSTSSYQNHTCSTSVAGGSDDLGYFKKGSEEADGTGRN